MKSATIHFGNDVFFDSVEYQEINDDIIMSSDEEAIRHFFTKGIPELRRFSYTKIFDPQFYIDYYDDANGLLHSEAYDHWIRIGILEHRFPNGKDLLQQLYNISISKFPDEFRFNDYAYMSGIPRDRKWRCLEHFIQYGTMEVEKICASGADADLLYKIGQSFEQNKPELAIGLYEAAVLSGNGTADILGSLGDTYLRSNRLYDAYQAYRKAIEIDGTKFWPLLNLSITAAKLGLADEAVDAAVDAARLNHSPYFSHMNVTKLARSRFASKWAAANRAAFGCRDREASAVMRQSINEYTNLEQHFNGQVASPIPAVESKLKVVIFGSDSIHQCKLYRIDQKIDQLNSIGQLVDFFPLSQSKELINSLMFYDVLLLYRAPATPDVIDLIKIADRYLIPTFYDIDDLIFDADCYPPSRESLENMVSAAEYAGLVTGRDLFRAAIEKCAFAIASTPQIQSRMSLLVKQQAYVHRNALGSLHAKMLLLNKKSAINGSKNITMFYGSGSRSHNENFNLIGDTLSKLMHKYASVNLLIAGPLELGASFFGLEDRIERVPFTTDMEQYWTLLSGADVNLAPLLINDFNDAKSEIKWMEAAMLGIPSVVSNSAVYNHILQNNINAFLARDEADWEFALETLINNPEVRYRVGLAAQSKVMSEYDVQNMGRSLLGIISEGRELYANRLLPKSASPRRPKILIVNVYYPPQFIGGATRVVEQNIHYAKKYSDEFDFEVICARDSGGEDGDLERYVWDGVNVTSFAPFSDADEMERSLKTEALFERIFDRLKPDLVHFHCMQRITASALDVALSRGIPHIVTIHDGWWISDSQFLIDTEGTPVYESGIWGNRLRLTRLRSALNACNKTIAVSESIAKIYRDRGINNIVVCPNGIDTSMSIPSSLHSHQVCLGLLGGLGLAKGSEVLSAALNAKSFTNLSFLIVDHAAVEGTVRYEWWGDNRVEIIGKTSFKNVQDVYSKINVVLAVSVCIESFGLVAREAAHLGRWVVVSDRGALAEAVEEGVNGHVIDISSPRELIRVLSRINANPSQYSSLAPVSIDTRSSEDQVQDIIMQYRELLQC